MKTKRKSILTLILIGALWSPLVVSLDEDGPNRDVWLKAQLMTIYSLNEHLKPFEINVDVKDSVAYLSGTVEDDIERDLAGELAKGVEGVRKVINNLQMDAGAKPDEARADEARGSISRGVEDANITAKVKWQLLWNANTHGLDIHVETHNARVILTGNVNRSVEADLAAQIARNTRGVQAVTRQIRVTPHPPMTERIKKEVDKAVGQVEQGVRDSWITAKAKAVLTFDRRLEGSGIEVHTKDGVVTLAGTVKNLAQHDHLITTVGDIVGVRKVRDKIRIEDKLTGLQGAVTLWDQITSEGARIW